MAQDASGIGFILAISVALCGCGLISDQAPSQAFPTDGVSGFGEAFPLEICLGTARIVAPAVASGAGAVCISDETATISCDSDDACRGIERCICGRCIVRACMGAAGCGVGEVCRGRRCTL